MNIRQQIHLVLRHDLVMGRENARIHASVTQVDLHDFCRLSMTYGLAGFHCVTAMEAQHAICADILHHWRAGFGKTYNPDRVQALAKLSLHHDFETMLAGIRDAAGTQPLIVGTSARQTDKELDFREFSNIIGRSGRPAIVVFGTSWGLSPEQIDRCDWVLPPIEGHDGYNHLSVRCAAAIITDRLFRNGAS